MIQQSAPVKRANKTKEIANTHAVRDAVLVERTRRRHGPGRQRGVVGERGEEGFQLEVRTERVCGPLCGDATKALLRMSQMVVRRRRHRHFGFGLGSSSDLPGLRHDHHLGTACAGHGPVCPFSRVPREHSAAVLLPFFVRPVIRQMGWLSSFSHDGTLQCSCYCKDKEKKNS